MCKRNKKQVKITAMRIDDYLRRELERTGWNQHKDKCCYISGRRYRLQSHHSGKSFGNIVRDAHKKLNIKYNPWMQNYDIVDLARLKVEVLKQHENNVQAITLNEDIHKELHRRFGKNVTPEQLEAFKAEYNKVKATA